MNILRKLAKNDGRASFTTCVRSALAWVHTNDNKAVNVNIKNALRVIAVEISQTQTDLLPIFACVPRVRIRHDYLQLKLAEESSQSGNGMHSLPQEQSA